MKQNEVLALQVEIVEVSKTMYKTWSRTETVLRADEEKLKLLTKQLDQMLQDTAIFEEKSARRRRLGY